MDISAQNLHDIFLIIISIVAVLILYTLITDPFTIAIVLLISFALMFIIFLDDCDAA